LVLSLVLSVLAEGRAAVALAQEFAEEVFLVSALVVSLEWE
jgi:hypothetical protein